MKEILLPPGYEDPYVNYTQWHDSRFGYSPRPEEIQRWQEHIKGLGLNEEVMGRRRASVIMRASVEQAIDKANRLMSDQSDSIENFTPVY